VFRVDGGGSSSWGHTEYRQVVQPAARDAITALQHYTGDVVSVIVSCTQRGQVSGWDLRAALEPFRLTVRPELGYPTSMTVAPDRCWLAVGTSRGFVALFDLRYQVMCRLWRHSSCSAIVRLACCKGLPAGGGGASSTSRKDGAAAGTGRESLPPSDGAYLFVAAGDNEAVSIVTVL
jgi:phosphoinositide-3-kinase regulatory subunit 4